MKKVLIWRLLLASCGWYNSNGVVLRIFTGFLFGLRCLVSLLRLLLLHLLIISCFGLMADQCRAKLMLQTIMFPDQLMPLKTSLWHECNHHLDTSRPNGWSFLGGADHRTYGVSTIVRFIVDRRKHFVFRGRSAFGRGMLHLAHFAGLT